MRGENEYHKRKQLKERQITQLEKERQRLGQRTPELMDTEVTQSGQRTPERRGVKSHNHRNDNYLDSPQIVNRPDFNNDYSNLSPNFYDDDPNIIRNYSPKQNVDQIM